MPNFAIHNGLEVTNVIVALSKEEAELFTNQQAFEITESIGIGWIFLNEKWYPPKPYNSWIFENNYWKAPVDKPQDEQEYIWDENILDWVVQNT